MSSLDGDRLTRLSTTLDASPRQLLVAAARLARLHTLGHVDALQRLAILRDATAAMPASERVGALLGTPIASYAQDDVDRALASLAAGRSAQDA
jgi:hypothetical protein